MKKNYVTLEEVCVKGSSNIAQKDLENNEGRYPIYGASGFIKNVDFYAQDKSYIAVVKDGAGIGRTMMLPAYSSVIGTMQYLLPKDNIDIGYLYYAVTAMNLAKYYTGATIPHIYFKDYRKEKMPVVDKIEQKKIVEVLSKIDALVICHKRQLDDFEVLVKSRFIELFGDPVSNPKNWAKKAIKEFATDVRYGTSKPAIEGGRYPYLRMNNLTYDGRLDLSDLKYIDIPDNELEKCVVKYGDILFNRTNSIELVGKTCLFEFNYPMVIAGYIIRIRLNDRVTPLYLTTYMNLEFMKKQLRNMAKGAVNQANINAQEMQSIIVPVPPLDLQNQFADFVEEVNKSKFTHCYELLLLIIKKIWYNNYV